MKLLGGHLERLRACFAGLEPAPAGTCGRLPLAPVGNCMLGAGVTRSTPNGALASLRRLDGRLLGSSSARAASTARTARPASAATAPRSTRCWPPPWWRPATPLRSSSRPAKLQSSRIETTPEFLGAPREFGNRRTTSQTRSPARDPTAPSPTAAPSSPASTSTATTSPNSPTAPAPDGRSRTSSS